MKVLMNGALGKMGAQIWTLLENGKKKYAFEIVELAREISEEE